MGLLYEGFTCIIDPLIVFLDANGAAVSNHAICFRSFVYGIVRHLKYAMSDLGTEGTKSRVSSGCPD